MQLETWRKSKGISQALFGKLLTPPITQAQVSQFERGATRITLDYALQIERVSSGAISPQDCFDLFSVRESKRSVLMK